MEHGLADAYTDLGWGEAAVESVFPSGSHGRLPIVYSQNYNITFCGLENFHVFDAKKFAKVVKLLEGERLLTRQQLWAAVEATEEQLCDVHSPDYIRGLYTSSQAVAQVIEVPAVGLFPNWLIQNRVARPWRFHAGGTMLAAGLALQYGWSINIGGGMHHASHDSGSGWCAYDDLHLALRKLRRATGGAIQKCLLIDLDVHQGNGHERDKLHLKDTDLYIVDVYGAALWPGDDFAKEAIDVDIAIPLGTADAAYLTALAGALKRAKVEFQPDVILYNAGTDILEGDPLGRMAVSAAGVEERDQAVWRLARDLRVPICMVLSGGYAKDNWRVVGNSLAELLRSFNLVDSDGCAQPLWCSS
eukprot:CAMPEP_0206135296 /NCGR_PEP_ID=MMETSP1473-20131121/612_1 /ASSEMBLY_ACC=CAM_ASM_001109 /TAXON_ID=1461547 /ORGANISM="Stichococcus sp, Strain RCC1054" /LENGTH=358 /DNA_ID=CAMNT_0053527103 /DNA_START=325 /DNA_END=1401 /DNA_ORIENTATION=-